MFLTYLMLFVALMLSAVAAFYSIVGLTAIFAAAVIPIIIMGSMLEAAKLVVTVWLHEYWRSVKLSMKLYLVPAVFILMVITSMGIFGFLSKAHLDQTVPTGDVAAQVSLIDEKINNERDTINNARTLLGQLDKAVSDISNTPDREVNGRTVSSAERALQVRRQQANDRSNLTRTIEAAQARIIKLQEEKAPFAKDLRKIEAEVGPIKYIAALIYGDNPDANLLEKAVRWVIIILVVVFDPLAIMMLLAATESFGWEKARRRQEIPADDVPSEQPAIDAVGKTKTWAQGLWQRFRRPEHATVDNDAIISNDLAGHSTRDRMDAEPVGEVAQQPSAVDEPAPAVDEPAPAVEPAPVKIEYKILEDIDEEVEIVALPPAPEKADINPDPVSEDLDDEDHDNDDNAMKIAKKLWKNDHPSATLKEQRRLHALGYIDRLPWLDYMPDPNSDIGHGPQFPVQAKKGDVWIRTDSLPTSLYKFNGDRWILIDKNMSDRYSYEESYIDFLIERISQGVYDPELLTEAEKGQIESRLRKDLQ